MNEERAPLPPTVSAVLSDRSFACSEVKTEVRVFYARFPKGSTDQLLAYIAGRWDTIRARAEKRAREHMKLAEAICRRTINDRVPDIVARNLKECQLIRCSPKSLRHNIAKIMNGRAAKWPEPPTPEMPNTADVHEIAAMLQAP